jgi:hypothetical protein
MTVKLGRIESWEARMIPITFSLVGALLEDYTPQQEMVFPKVSITERYGELQIRDSNKSIFTASLFMKAALRLSLSRLRQVRRQPTMPETQNHTSIEKLEKQLERDPGGPSCS